MRGHSAGPSGCRGAHYGLVVLLLTLFSGGSLSQSISLATTSQTVTEGSASSITLDGSLTVSSTNNLVSASVVISAANNFDSGRDKLTISGSTGGTTNSITYAWGDGGLNGAGTLSFSGTTSASVYQSLLRTVTYTNSAMDSYGNTRTLVYTVTDSTGATGTASYSLTYSAINNAPTLAGLNRTTTVQYDVLYSGSAVAMQPSLLLYCTERANIASASVKITAGIDTSGDTLAIGSAGTSTVSSTGVSQSYASSTGILSITGAASCTAYQKMLRAVTLTHSNGGKTNYTSRTVTWAVTDASSISVGQHTSQTLSQTIVSTYNMLLPKVTAASSAPSTIGAAVNFTGSNLGPFVPIGGFIVLNGDTSVCGCTTVATAVSNGNTTISYQICQASCAAGLVVKVTVGSSACGNVTLVTAQTGLSCTVPAGTGSGIYVSVKAGGQNSDSTVASPFFTYANPTVTNVTGVPVSAGGGIVTITGTNFGPNVAGIQQANGGAITFGSNSTSTVTAVTYSGLSNFLSTSYPPYICINPVMATAHTVVTCTAPAGVGQTMDTVLTVAGLDSGYTGTATVLGSSSSFSYAAPTITSVSKGSPFGYYITIVGTNFGPVTTAPASGSVTNVNVTLYNSALGGYACTSAYVSVVNTTIICTAPAASSAGGPIADTTATGYSIGYDVYVAAGIYDSTLLPATNIQTTSSSSAFYYEPPTITSIKGTDDDNTNGKLNMFGGMVLIQGRNFGSSGALVNVIFTSLNASAVSNYTVTLSSSAIVGTGSQASLSTGWTTSPSSPAVSSTHYNITAYVPDYVSTGGSMTPNVQIAIYYAVNSSYSIYLPSLAINTTYLSYEGPVITNFVGADGTSGYGAGGSQFGADPQWNYYGQFRLVGRNFGVYSTYASSSTLVTSNFGSSYFQSLFSSSCAILKYPSRTYSSTSDDFSYVVRTAKSLILSTSTAMAYAAIFIGGVQIPTSPVCACATGSTSITPCAGSYYATGSGQAIKVISDNTVEFALSPATAGSPLSGTNLTITLSMLCTGSSISTCQNSTCVNCKSTGAGLWAYLGPLVSSVNTVSTAGGTLTIQGRRFGTVSSSPVGAIIVACLNSGCTKLFNCSSPAVLSDYSFSLSGTSFTETDGKITCTVPAATAATGVAYVPANITLALNGQTSVLTSAFSHTAPSITNVTGSGASGTVLDKVRSVWLHLLELRGQHLHVTSSGGLLPLAPLLGRGVQHRFGLVACRPLPELAQPKVVREEEPVGLVLGAHA